MRIRTLGGLMAVALLAACGGGGGGSSSASDDDVATPPAVPVTWFQPQPGTRWHWQLLVDDVRPLNESFDAVLYGIDLELTAVETIQRLKAEGKRVICYFSAGTFEDFRTDADAFVAAELGEPLADFPNERWLDVRSENVARIMRSRLDLARDKGCDGVDPDNVDGYINRTGFDLTAADQRAYNRFIAEEAHARDLAVGLKNDLGQINELVGWFDFAVNEQCHQFNECAALSPFVAQGKPVFNIEYETALLEDDREFAAMCALSASLGIDSVVMPPLLDGRFRRGCDD